MLQSSAKVNPPSIMCCTHHQSACTSHAVYALATFLQDSHHGACTPPIVPGRHLLWPFASCVHSAIATKPSLPPGRAHACRVGHSKVMHHARQHTLADMRMHHVPACSQHGGCCTLISRDKSIWPQWHMSCATLVLRFHTTERRPSITLAPHTIDAATYTHLLDCNSLTASNFYKL